MPPLDGKTYTNADIEAVLHPKSKMAALRPPPQQRVPYLESGQSVEDLLAQAKGTLSRLDPIDPALEPPMAVSHGPEPDAPQPPSGLRRFTNATDLAAGGLALSSLVPAPTSVPLGTAALIAGAPGAARRLIHPDPDESRGWGAVESAMYALPFMGRLAKPAVKGAMGALGEWRGARAATKAFATEQAPLRAGRETLRGAGVRMGEEIGYRAPTATTNPNQVLQTARDIAAETGEPLDAVIKQWGKSKGAGGTEAVQALQRLAGSGKARATPPMGRAAKDMAERRVNPSGQLPPGISERRYSELLATLGGGMR